MTAPGSAAGELVDAEIARLVGLLNRLPGIQTGGSCSGHPPRDPHPAPSPYITLRPRGDEYERTVERLKQVIAEEPLPCEVKVAREFAGTGHQVRILAPDNFKMTQRTWGALEGIVARLLR